MNFSRDLVVVIQILTHFQRIEDTCAQVGATF
jgi:hypothetical protein